MSEPVLILALNASTPLPRSFTHTSLPLKPVTSRETWQATLQEDTWKGVLCADDLTWSTPESLAQEARRLRPEAWCALVSAHPLAAPPPPFDEVLRWDELTLERLHPILANHHPPTPLLATDGHDLEHSLQALLDGLDALLAIHMAGVYWLDEAQEVLRLRLLRSQDEHLRQQLEAFPIPIGQGIIGLVARNGQPLWVNHAERDPRSVYPGPPPPTEHLIALPLQLNERAVGVLALARTQDPPFTEEEFHLAQMYLAHMNLAVENAYLLEATRHHAAELDRALSLLAVLHRVGTQVTQAEAPEGVLHTLERELRPLHISFALLRWNPVERSLHLSHIALPQDAREQIEHTLGHALTDLRFTDEQWPHFTEVVRQGNTIFGPPHAHDLRALFPQVALPALKHIIHLSGLEETMRMVQVPLRVHERSMGILVLWGPDLQESDVPALYTFGTQVALALDKAEKLSRERQRVRQLNDLRLAFGAISQHLDPAELLQRVLQHGIRLLNAEAGQIARYEPEQQHLVVMASLHLDMPADTVLPLGAGALGQAALHAEPLHVEDYPAWPHALPAYRHQIREVIAAPLLHGGTLQGALSLASRSDKRHFTADDLNLLMLYARQVAIALENARLFQQVKELSTIDELTGLYNRRHLFTLGQREYRRALRFRRPLSVIMLDLDHFKQVNDTFGHRIGDQVLHGLAQRCLRHMREVDTLARYGGEEFAALLPEAPLAAAVRIAERLRNAVAQAPFPTLAGDIPITISLGVAELSPQADSFTTLLEHADRGLYQAKRQGRNRVAAYSPAQEGRS